MATLNPPINCLRGVIFVPATVASALGLPALSQEIQIACWIATSPIGGDQIIALLLNGAWKDITVGDGTPGSAVIDGQKFDNSMIESIKAEMRAMGVKAWVARNFVNFVTNLLREFFKRLGMATAGGNPSTPTDGTDFEIDWRTAANESLGRDFVLEDRNGDGIPDMYAR